MIFNKEKKTENKEKSSVAKNKYLSTRKLVISVALSHKSLSHYEDFLRRNKEWGIS